MIYSDQSSSHPFANSGLTTFRASAAEGPRAHVLIVDDHDINRTICAAYCDIFDFTSESACDGEEAVEAARRGDFDVILMDIHMPGMDGLEATRRIRALPGRIGRTPIIAVTTDVEDAPRYLASGMTSVVAKPVTAARLYSAIDAAVAVTAAEPRSWVAAG